MKSVQLTAPTGSLFGGDTSDEIYFITAGFLNRGIQNVEPISNPRICPPQKDYYRVSDPQEGGGALAAQQIGLWYGKLNPNDTLYLTVVVAEQDNKQLKAIEDAVSGALNVVGGILAGDPPDKVLQIALQLASKLFDDLTQNSGDKILASFVVSIKNDGKDQPQVQWTLASPQFMNLQTPSNALTAQMTVAGHAAYPLAQYSLNASVARAISFRSKRSGKNIDVPWNSLDDSVRLQQFTAKPHTNDDSNQRWILWPQSIKLDEDKYCPWYQIINENSLKCFDVANGSTDNHAAINQYTPKQAKDQNFTFDPNRHDSFADWDNQLWGYDWHTFIINNKRCKVVDLPIYNPDISNQDGLQLQQYDENHGDNQQWQME